MFYISLVWHFHYDKRTKCNNIQTCIIENRSQFVLIEVLSKCLPIDSAKFDQLFNWPVFCVGNGRQIICTGTILGCGWPLLALALF